MQKRFLLVLVVCYFSSCVPNKDLVYLQGDATTTKKSMHRLNQTPYKLQVDDIIAIDIKAKNEGSVALFKKTSSDGGGNNTEGYSVDLHGNIRLPYIGEVNILGYTTKEVRLKLEQELLQYLKNEEDFFVTVALAGIKYTIMGEVGSTGVKVSNQNRLNIFQAISNSGDITITGNRKNVELWRNAISGRKRYEIDLTSVEAFDSEVFYIQPNDLIYVRPLKQKSWGTGTTGLGSLTSLISLFTLMTSTILIVRNL